MANDNQQFTTHNKENYRLSSRNSIKTVDDIRCSRRSSRSCSTFGRSRDTRECTNSVISIFRVVPLEKGRQDFGYNDLSISNCIQLLTANSWWRLWNFRVDNFNFTTWIFKFLVNSSFYEHQSFIKEIIIGNTSPGYTISIWRGIRRMQLKR